MKLLCSGLLPCTEVGRCYLSSDVVETVTSETKTWFKFRDETEQGRTQMAGVGVNPPP